MTFVALRSAFLDHPSEWPKTHDGSVPLKK